MTSWNLRTLFSRNPLGASPGSSPLASFDPGQTGDPSTGAAGRAGLDVGHAGRVGSVGLPHRNPIGFAPPADPLPDLPCEPRFRTEISFKRHHEAPRASATPDGPEESPAEPWQTPEPVFTEGGARLDASPAGTDVAAVVDDEMPAAVERVPFYKREISFRRKRATLEEVPDPVVASEAGEVVEEAAVPDLVEVVAHEDAPAEHNASGTDSVDVVAVVESSAEPPVADEAVEPLEDETVVEELEPAPVAGANPLAALEAGSEADDFFIEDTPAPKRFSSRRGKSTEKAPKRKAPRGGKGRRVVGLKIGASQIAAAVIVESDGRHELVQLARRPIDSGLVVDGEIRDADALAHQLKLFFSEHDLPKKGVRIGLASNRIGVRTFEIEGIDDKTKFDNAVRFRAHEVLPVAQHESVLDYRVLEERLTEEGATIRRILLVVAPRDQIEPYVDVAERAGVRLAGLDLEALSLLRAFVAPKPFAARAADDTSTVVVSIGHESTTLLVSGGGACEFTRVFDWGGGTLEDAVMHALNVPHAEAITILRHLSLSGPGRRYEALDDAARAKAIEAVRLRLTPFARELVSSLQFYQTQPDSLGIGEIVITGGTSHLEGLGESLNQMIGVRVRVGDPLGRVHFGGELDSAIEATIGSMSVPIGLAIEDERMRSVDLLPSDVRASARRRPSLATIALPVAVAVPVVALGFLFVSAHGQVSDRQSQIDAIRAEIDALPKPQRAVIDASLQGAQAQRAQAVATVLGSRVAWDAVLRDVSRVLPRNVWLSSLQAQVPATPAQGATPAAATVTPGLPASPTGALIDGYTFAQTDVARVLARLATLPTLSNVTLTSSKLEAKGAKSVVRFQIAADLNNGGAW